MNHIPTILFFLKCPLLSSKLQIKPHSPPQMILPSARLKSQKSLDPNFPQFFFASQVPLIGFSSTILHLFVFFREFINYFSFVSLISFSLISSSILFINLLSHLIEVRGIKKIYFSLYYHPFIAKLFWLLSAVFHLLIITCYLIPCNTHFYPHFNKTLLLINLVLK